jgi:hypothetical protein
MESPPNTSNSNTLKEAPKGSAEAVREMEEALVRRIDKWARNHTIGELEETKTHIKKMIEKTYKTADEYTRRSQQLKEELIKIQTAAFHDPRRRYVGIHGKPKKKPAMKIAMKAKEPPKAMKIAMKAKARKPAMKKPAMKTAVKAKAEPPKAMKEKKKRDKRTFEEAMKAGDNWHKLEKHFDKKRMKMLGKDVSSDSAGSSPCRGSASSSPCRDADCYCNHTDDEPVVEEVD